MIEGSCCLIRTVMSLSNSPMSVKKHSRFLTKKAGRILLVTTVLFIVSFLLFQHSTTGNSLFNSPFPGEGRKQPKRPIAEEDIATEANSNKDGQISNRKNDHVVDVTTVNDKAKKPSSNQPNIAEDSSDNIGYNPADRYQKILDMAPVIIFSKTTCPYSLKLKSLLTQNYQFTPDYVVIELDLEKRTKELQFYISQQTGRKTVPNLLVNGKSMGGHDEISALHSKGELLKSIEDWSDKKVTVTPKQKST
ncbi:glutathione-disulfide reductase GRX7 Ecym_5313 [Eremothecium cymbalariae DBVPG|uniref:Glutaredoxin domain-containing protein n=1 Tax=Eremothecium cymbalariae (strain CBS 270.75 / DBVPG 7215 / KCTC 17166 / NRRL Y-17582) TaxID=931890 RepID=I6NDD2_ERECY|nr:hypothetical protein Ecym_5313 [Eremothecium cymbalariae DBVPG\